MESVLHYFKLFTLATQLIFHIKMVKLCREVNYMRWVNKDLELQYWEYLVKLNKTRIPDIMMLAPNKNPQRYKEHVI